MVRSRRDAGGDHAVSHPLRAARCPREADAGPVDVAEPGRILDGVERRSRLRVRPAQGSQISQRRSAGRRGREVLVRALQGRGRRGAQSARKKYVERVGDDGFKKAPVGAGPYRFVSFTPGIELVVEAFDGYWRTTPAVKRLVFKSVPDDSTRLVMLKRGETDIAAGFRGPNAEEVKRTPGLTLRVTLPTVSQWVVFTEQWDPRSPWADRRVRLAANLAIDRKAFSDAEFLGHGRPASSIIPRDFDFYWTPPAYPYDPARAKQLLAEAGYPKGFDAVELATDVTFAPESEAVINGLRTVGIRARLRPLERASFYKADQDKQFKHLVRVGSGAAGNAATRIEAFVISGGIRAYGGYPDIDALFRDQAVETDRRRREALLHKIQQLMHERAMFAPIVEQAVLTGVGPRVAEVPTITGHPFISPYEDLRLKGSSP
ncbi:MAG: hypothetical protein DME13_00310 [Candidatus Rokuibacteriota bacterium]|nr:MAG: hypothetical protein DME13_00310 [Candidatus Rokubacteria bacterium]